MSQPCVSITNGGPDEAIDLAMRVVSFGADFAGAARKLVEEIRQIEAQHPEGVDDECAVAFRRGYVKPAEDTQRGCIDSGQAWSQLGLTVANVLSKLGATDADGADAISSTV